MLARITRAAHTDTKEYSAAFDLQLHLIEDGHAVLSNQTFTYPTARERHVRRATMRLKGLIALIEFKQIIDLPVLWGAEQLVELLARLICTAIGSLLGKDRLENFIFPWSNLQLD